MKGRPWTTEDRDILRNTYPHEHSRDIAKRLNRSERAIYSQAKALKLKKSPEYLANKSSGRIHKGEQRGKSTQFAKGHRPHNKGVKGWNAGGDAKKHQYQKGHKPHTWKPLGSERVTKEGYLQRKVSATGYPPRDWKNIHHIVWEAENGPIPKGHIVVFIDGDKMNISLDNLELITRSENMRRNTIHNLPEELADVCRLKGRVQRQINKRSRHEKQN